MHRITVRKMLWLAKGAAMFWGAVFTLALVFGVATVALAAVPGDPFRLGQANNIDVLTRLAGEVPGASMLVVDNDSSAAGSRALDLRVEAGKAPMNISAGAGKATNLNADQLDGLSADEVGINGLEIVSDTTFPRSSSSGRFARADCSDGKVVVGAGYFVGNGTTGSVPDVLTDISVTTVEPHEDYVYVSAYEEEPTAEEWSLAAKAICATVGTP